MRSNSGIIGLEELEQILRPIVIICASRTRFKNTPETLLFHNVHSNIAEMG